MIQYTIVVLKCLHYRPCIYNGHVHRQRQRPFSNDKLGVFFIDSSPVKRLRRVKVAAIVLVAAQHVLRPAFTSTRKFGGEQGQRVTRADHDGIRSRHGGKRENLLNNATKTTT